MGVGENIKGTLKEKAGELSGNDELEAEGRAQRQKGEQQTRENKERAEAQVHEKKADALEREQDALED
ncbi:MAG: CsbD-like [Pseudonocardiales bacterium]|jgi:uncharacterized protein YjbJ (UPF0337 family)|nr:CsbD-like [Pseudonocardiales bacterium]